MRKYDEAFAWYTRSALKGDPHAQYRLGRAYERGLGTTADPVEACRWYMLASARGQSQAAESVSRLSGVLTAEQIGEAKRRAAETPGGKP
jgi:TPR repeat protein